MVYKCPLLLQQLCQHMKGESWCNLSWFPQLLVVEPQPHIPVFTAALEVVFVACHNP